MSEEKKWVLSHGIHKGTMMSRDSGQDEKFDTREDAMKAFSEHRRWYASIGYMIWFAYLIDPEGNKTLLEQNPYYD